MNMERIKVIFETVTPLFMDDANRNPNLNRPSEILGSMRFWFDVACVYGGLYMSMNEVETKYKNSPKNNKSFDVFLKESLLNNVSNNNISYNSWSKTYLSKLHEYLSYNQLPKSAMLFGTTGIEANLRIIGIEQVNIQILKINVKIIKYNGKSNTQPGKIDFPTYYGKFAVLFEVNEQLIEGLFYPLLNFLDEFGYIGGKWNWGFGRVKIIDVMNENKKDIYKNFTTFKFSPEESFKISNINEILWDVDTVSSSTILQQFEKLGLCIYQTNNCAKYNNEKTEIKLNYAAINTNNQNNNSILTSILKEMGKLINCKLYLRRKFRNHEGFTPDEEKELRHRIFGISGKEGSKLLPYIKDSNCTKTGFLSLISLFNAVEVGGEKNAR
ncbi:RAMP superfamily CRISPR-associated protein [Anaerocellum danielii]|uniref:RAMP superfamily CRISPR-associated protein n=1 Tax=Anaerocellum danielii TaxID=1387557 RepID=A0ABZ0U0Z0_9FIRM|nr:RAMP superfamily CRISPR-associated protein [Caldicellulosiruptor danielii]WPX08971.1 RAMP superfamily CRISPR-associated protein [Caldicellulosiruptor danielii]